MNNGSALNKFICAIGLIIFSSISVKANETPEILSLFNKPKEALSYHYCATPKTAWENNKLKQLLMKYSASNTRQYVDQRVVAILVSAASRVAQFQTSFKACEETLQNGDKLFQSTFSQAMENLLNQNSEETFSDGQIGNIQKAIHVAWLEDQSSRTAYIQLLNPKGKGTTEDWAFEKAKANAVKLDGQHRSLIKSLLETYHWITSAQFGAQTSNRALTLIQHADAEPEFQKRALKRMEPYVKNGTVNGTAFANLWDRVAVNTGKKQRYGTQPKNSCNKDGTLSILPVEAPEKLAQLRQQVGLEPLAEQLQRLSLQRCQ
ncbi:hypothetical protein KFE96_13475 [Kordiimonas sp. SCSIO 12603]|uniref:DUF6624 domain-containing protein n=1 Tax=Kordiimonas sp. SCSIO 12603 TaxID=2829596 RepID=UPI002104C084|nr:DUF6624 domain-containing protein [Kordiimonas sp. SCSIO 12603]UTW57834.1 hypothetical protein KFE96_13475 [Kordiimonas sp. SCSIO 12603]